MSFASASRPREQAASAVSRASSSYGSRLSMCILLTSLSTAAQRLSALREFACCSPAGLNLQAPISCTAETRSRSPQRGTTTSVLNSCMRYMHACSSTAAPDVQIAATAAGRPCRVSAFCCARLSDVAVPASSRRSTRSRTNCDAGLGKALCMLAGCCAAAPPCGAAGPRSPAAPACRFSGCPGPGTLSTSTCARTRAAARRDCKGGAVAGERAVARGCCQAVRQAPGVGGCRRIKAGGPRLVLRDYHLDSFQVDNKGFLAHQDAGLVCIGNLRGRRWVTCTSLHLIGSRAGRSLAPWTPGCAGRGTGCSRRSTSVCLSTFT